MNKLELPLNVRFCIAAKYAFPHLYPKMTDQWEVLCEVFNLDDSTQKAFDFFDRFLNERRKKRIDGGYESGKYIYILRSVYFLNENYNFILYF